MLETNIVMNGCHLNGKSWEIFHLIFRVISHSSLEIWHFLKFLLSRFGFGILWKVFVVVCDGCTCGKKTIQFFFHIVVDNYDFSLAYGPWKLIKIYKFRSQGATILGAIKYLNDNIYMLYFFKMKVLMVFCYT
jgi:hypothetical protein